MSGARGGLLLVVLAAFLFLNTFRHQWVGDIADSADDAAYWSYAATLGIDGDIDFTNELGYGQYMAPNYRVPQAFYGTGLMAAPFVGLFSALDRLNGHPILADRTQYANSWSYFGFSFAAQFYFLAAVGLYWAAFRGMKGRPSALMTLLLCGGSGVLYFVLSRPRMSHAFEFFALALVVFASLRGRAAWEQGGKPGRWLMLAALAVNLALAVRFSDLAILALPPIILLSLPGERDFGSVLRLVAMWLVALMLTYAPFGWLSWIFYDAVLPTTKAVYGSASRLPPVQSLADAMGLLRLGLSLLPDLCGILFGGEFGLLWCMPVAVIGVALLLIHQIRSWRVGRRREAGLALILTGGYVGLDLAVVLLWGNPGSSYGWRYLFTLVPLGLVGWAAADCNARVKVLLAMLSLFALLSSLAYGKLPGLQYEATIYHGEIPMARAPHYLPNLVAELAGPTLWLRLAKDGPAGYVVKALLPEEIGRRFTDPGAVLVAPGPPILGWNLLVLAVLWAGFARWLLRAEACSCRK